MAHYAILNQDNEVIDIIAGIHEYELNDLPEGYSNWEEFYSMIKNGQKVLRTSFNTKAGIHYDPETDEPSSDQSKAFRGNYATIGGTYDSELDIFLPPKLYEYFVYDSDNLNWKPPIEKPNDGFVYYWDDETYQNDNTTGWVRIYRPDEE